METAVWLTQAELQHLATISCSMARASYVKQLIGDSGLGVSMVKIWPYPLPMWTRVTKIAQA